MSSTETSTCTTRTSNTQAATTSLPNTTYHVAGTSVGAGAGDGATQRGSGSSSSGRGAVETWSGGEVQAFVRGLKEDFGDRAEGYAEAMAREDVDGRVLLQLQQVFSLFFLYFSFFEYAEAMACEDVHGRVLLQLQEIFPSFVASTECAWMR